MAEINLSNSAGRDAKVNFESVRVPLNVRWLDGQGRQVSSVRVLKATVDRDADSLAEQLDDSIDLATALIKGDPEVDMERYGSFLHDTSRVYLNSEKHMVHKMQQWEIVRNPDGTERQRRPRNIPVANVAGETPLRWTGKMLKKEDVYRKFVFAGKMQIIHNNGLTYDFLYSMAKELEEKQSLMLVGAGPKSNQPLVFRRGATPYRGFLEGRTQGDKYCLLLHLSNMELKAPEPAAS